MTNPLDAQAKLREAAVAATAIGDEHDWDTVLKATAEAIDRVLGYSEVIEWKCHAETHIEREEKLLDKIRSERNTLTEENKRLREVLQRVVDLEEGRAWRESFHTTFHLPIEVVEAARAALTPTDGVPGVSRLREGTLRRLPE